MTELNRGFFAVDLEQFYNAVDLGMAEACLYLIYCCGSGKSNDKTSWSVNALNNHTGLKSARKGKLSAERLKEAGLTKQLKGGKHPQFQIIQLKDSEKVWLPNTFVTGATGEVSPLERLRKTGEPAAMKLLIDFYARCNVADDGGIQTDIIYQKYERKKIGEYKQFTVFGFDYKNIVTYAGKIIHHLTDEERLEFKKKGAGHSNIQSFWDNLKLLERLSLIYAVPTLFDSDNGEPIVAMYDPFSGDYCEQLSMLNDQFKKHCVHEISEHDQYLFVPKTYPNAVLKGVYIPRYRQNTELVAAGYAETQNRLNDYLKILHKAYEPKESDSNFRFVSFSKM